MKFVMPFLMAMLLINSAAWSQTPTPCAHADTTTAFNQASIQTFTGTASGVQDLRRLFGVADQVNFVLVTPEKQNYMVSLAPGSFLEENNFELENDDQVTVTGSLMTIQGRPTIMATEIQKDGQTLRIRERDGTPLWKPKQEQQRRRQ